MWTPSEDRIENSNLKRYKEFLFNEYDLQFANYSELHKWSTTDIETFWQSIWKFSGIVHSKTYERVLDKRIMPGANWFEGTELNFAENLLRYKDDHTAIISSREDQPDVVLSYRELYKLVTACTAGLKEIGIKKGDIVAGYVTNIPETIIAMLAATNPRICA